MAAEVSLKEESALEIGKQLAVSFQGLKAVGADTANNALELEEEREQTSYLEKISGGIKKMVVFFGSLAAATKEARRERLITEAQGTEEEKEALKKDSDRSFDLKGFKDKITEITKGFKTTIMPVFGIFKGLLGKAMLFGLLLAFALNLNKFSEDLKPIVSNIVNGFKAAFTSLKEDFFPLIDNFIKLIGSAFDSVSNILKIFEGDFASFAEGLGGLADVALRIVSVIGDAFFSLVDAVLKFFGVESQMIQDIKMAFRTFPEAVKNAVTGFFNFFTETLPNAFNEAINNLKTELKKDVDFIRDRFVQIFTDIKDAILAPFIAIRDKVKGVIGGVKDFFTGTDEKVQAEKMSKGQMTLEQAKAKQRQVFDQIHSGDNSNRATYSASDKSKMQMYNAMVIDADPTRGEAHKALNSTQPMLYADYDYRDERKDLDFAAQQALSDRNTLRSLTGNDLPSSNTPMIEPNELMNNGGQLNKDSQEFASTNVVPPSMNVVTGGTTNTTSSNTTVTNIAESTTTSDMNVKKIFKTA